MHGVNPTSDQPRPRTHHNTCPRGERCACYLTGYSDAEYDHGLALNTLDDQPRPSDEEWQHKIADFVNLILHGDDEHKAWLREAGEAFILGKSMPPPRQKRFACAYCHRGMESGVNLLRVNKLGDIPAIWICTEHFNYDDWKQAR
jgi:hypothetical protein